MSRRAGLIFDYVSFGFIMSAILWLGFGPGEWKTVKAEPSGLVAVVYPNQLIEASYSRISAATGRAYDRQIERMYPQEIRIIK